MFVDNVFKSTNNYNFYKHTQPITNDFFLSHNLNVLKDVVACQFLRVGSISHLLTYRLAFFFRLFRFKGRFLLFQVYRNFANLFFKLSVSTFYKVISLSKKCKVTCKSIRLAVFLGIP